VSSLYRFISHTHTREDVRRPLGREMGSYLNGKSMDKSGHPRTGMMGGAGQDKGGVVKKKIENNVGRMLHGDKRTGIKSQF